MLTAERFESLGVTGFLRRFGMAGLRA